MSHYAFCGLSREHLGELVTELAPQWEARCESGRHRPGAVAPGGARRRWPKFELVRFTDRLLVTLVHLRTGLTHEALGVIWPGRIFRGGPGDGRSAGAAAPW